MLKMAIAIVDGDFLQLRNADAHLSFLKKIEKYGF